MATPSSISDKEWLDLMSDPGYLATVLSGGGEKACVCSFCTHKGTVACKLPGLIAEVAIIRGDNTLAREAHNVVADRDVCPTAGYCDGFELVPCTAYELTSLLVSSLTADRDIAA